MDLRDLPKPTALLLCWALPLAACSSSAEEDPPAVPDSGVRADTGVRLDSGVVVDTGVDNDDRGFPGDSGQDNDAGLENDSGAGGDTGVTEPDTGVTEPDTGVTNPDTGVAEPDTGVIEPDTGVAEPDSGVTTPDAGTPDTGVISGLPSAVATHVAVGRAHACAITSVGRVRCWGAADYGQLGNGVVDGSSAGLFAEPIEISSITSGATHIASFANHTCAVVNGGVRCWGENGEGQLGTGNFNDASTPVTVSLPVGFVATRVAVSEESTCALSAAGAVRCWGKNDYGQLGDGSLATGSNSPVQPTGLGSGVVAIAAGATHFCAAMSSGGMKCWGSNLYGEMGLGQSGNGAQEPVDVTGLGNATIVDVGAGQNYSCAIPVNGALSCWGRNYDGQLGIGTSGFNADALLPTAVVGVSSGASELSGGYGATCGIVGGGAYCWGSNLNLVLGNGGNSSDVSDVPVAVTGLGSGVTSISASSTDHACAVANGAVWCWGSAGPFLGTGDVTTNAPSPVAVLSLP